MTKDEAIKIIQTEMECVSRPDCDRLACAYCDLAMRAEDVLTAYQMALTALQTDGDAISRADAIRVASGYCHPANVAKELAKLPSVQPDNSCDGCKYEDVDDGVLVPCGYCGRSHPDNYERRTDGTD